ncbi:MAG: hypothetical protein H7836_16570 [Magnetococcus sp. YQC-3]
MNSDLRSTIGIGMASLLAISWPAAYLVSRMHAGSDNLTAAHQWVDPRRHAVSNEPPCAAPENKIKAFRMGIDSDYPLFPRKNAP